MNAKLLHIWRVSRWHFAFAASRMSGQRLAASGLLCLWITVLIVIDLPLQAETRKITAQLTDDRAHGPEEPPHASPQSAPDDITREFIVSLPAFSKSVSQLRALDELADRSGVAITSAHYRYEHLSRLPLVKVALSIVVQGEEKQQRRFLQTALNGFPKAPS